MSLRQLKLMRLPLAATLALIALSACLGPTAAPPTSPAATAGATSPVVATATPPADPTATAVAAAASPAACTASGQTWRSPVDGAQLMCVPAGDFLMGAAPGAAPAGESERPQHPVYLDAFWIDQTEVTNAQFAQCLAEGGCHPAVYEITATTYIPYSAYPGYERHPALVYVAEDAVQYCRWAGRRLPSEAEWEKAARGPAGRIFPWGDQPDLARINFVPVEDRFKLTTEGAGPRCGYSAHCGTLRVDDLPAGASPYGVLNTLGNVWEWVNDFYAADYYTRSPRENPRGPAAGEYRVRRGGGWRSLTAELRVTIRASGSPHHYFDGQMGFRCARDATP